MAPTYGSSGVSCTGSSVNSGGKFARSRSDSSLGRYGGGTCFCSSCKKIDETSRNKNNDDGDKKLVDIRRKNMNPKIDLALTAQQYNIRVA